MPRRSVDFRCLKLGLGTIELPRPQREDKCGRGEAKTNTASICRYRLALWLPSERFARPEMPRKNQNQRNQGWYTWASSHQRVFDLLPISIGLPKAAASSIAICARSGQDNMQFRQLRYFVKIVEAGSFSRA